MFPAVLTRASHVRRILVVALAALMLFAILAIAPGAPRAEADPIKTGTITFLFRHTNGDTELVSEAFTAETGQTYFFKGAGGASATTPTGMPVHVSCSDTFASGWSDIAGGRPDPVLDPEWYVVDFYIDKDGPAAACGNPDILRTPSIDIEKATNGVDADNPTGPEITVGGLVTWSYVVTNNGQVALSGIQVSDDNGTPGDTGDDFDVTCPQTDLAVTESMTCTPVTGTATLGQYANIATVVDNQGDGSTVTDEDPSHYLGVEEPPLVPSIDIEKATNGVDADNPTGPTLTVGDPVTWTYVVTNNGDVDLTNVKVTDDELGDICVIGDLASGASDTCTATGTAVLGQYANIGDASGEYAQGETTVSDTDPSHYWGVVAPVPGVHIEKATNGVDADEAPGVPIDEGAQVTWTYVVTNTGDVPLSNVLVTDDQGVVPVYQSGDTDGDDLLDLTETWTYEATGEALLINYANIGLVVGYYGEEKVTDDDPSHYGGISVSGTAQLGDTVWYDANENGVQDNGEDGINGAKITLTDTDGNVVATETTVTGPWNGFYKFLELDAGTYTATLDMSSVKSTYELTTAGAITITIVDGDDYVDADFGLVEPEEELPKTGIDSQELGLVALGLLAIGTLAVLATRKQGREER